MKFFVRILSIFTCILILSACTNPFKKAEQAVEDGQARIYTCDDLKNEDIKQVCIKNMSDLVVENLNDEIINTFDTKRCVELPQEMANDCVNKIKETGVVGPISKAELEALNNAMVMVYPDVVAETGDTGADINPEGYYDPAKCASLTTIGLKEYCEKAIEQKVQEEKANEIIEKGDSSACDTLQSEEIKAFCLDQLGIYPEIKSELTEEELNLSDPENSPDDFPTNETREDLVEDGDIM